MEEVATWGGVVMGGVDLARLDGGAERMGVKDELLLRVWPVWGGAAVWGGAEAGTEVVGCVGGGRSSSSGSVSSRRL